MSSLLLTMKLTRGAAERTRQYAKSMPSLEKAFEAKVEERKKEVTRRKEKNAIYKETQLKLHEEVERKVKGEEPKLEGALARKDSDMHWKVWSQAAEQDWLRYLGDEKILNSAFTGRGQVKIRTADPNIVKKKDCKEEFRCEDAR